MRRPTVIIFDNFGPYHWARVAAAASCFPTIAVEVREKTDEYLWDRTPDTARLARYTIISVDDIGSAALIWTQLHKLLTQLDPGAVAMPGWSSAAALAALHWCLSNRRPAIVMSESNAGDENRTYLQERIKHRVISRFSAALVGGVAHTRYLQSLGMAPNRIETGYDVVDNEHFAHRAEVARREAESLRANLGLPKRYLLASCRFIPKKNLSRLIEAYALYRQDAASPDPMSLVILGDGPLRASLNSQLSTLNLHHHVQLPGFKQYEELPNYYALAEGFVHASTTEQWGLVVNEAMAAGLPVLISNCCGCASELVSEGENGWVFDPTDVRQISQLMAKLGNCSTDRRAEMAEAGQNRIKDFSPAHFAKGLKAAWQTAESWPLPNLRVWDSLLLRALASRNAL